jgi:tetratricopeptide (TPR) repeat protein
LTTTTLQRFGRALPGSEKGKALEFYDQALPLLRSAGDRAGEGNALDNAGVAYSGTGDPRKALFYYDQAAEIFRELQDRRRRRLALTPHPVEC